MAIPTALAAPHLTLDDRKRAARVRARAVLQSCDPARGLVLGERVLASGLVAPGAVVAGFWPMGREIDITPLLRGLRLAGHTVALPRTPARGLPLTFHRWAETDGLVREPFGTMTSDGPAVRPDLLLVPLLAFDRRGHRLGYGGGYYDRTFATRPGIPAIGCAYSEQEVTKVPSGPTDVPLVYMATDRELVTCRISHSAPYGRAPG